MRAGKVVQIKDQSNASSIIVYGLYLEPREQRRDEGVSPRGKERVPGTGSLNGEVKVKIGSGRVEG